MAIIRRPKIEINCDASLDENIASVSDLLRYAKEKGIDTNPVDIKQLVRAFGIRIVNKQLEDEVSGILECSNGKWEVTVNSLHHPRRQRFTLAHELAHYMLHRDQQKRFEDHKFFRSEYTSKMEREADQFAADLLMPNTAFRSFVLHNSKIEEVAEHFQVSALAVRVRAKTLGYSGHNL